MLDLTSVVLPDSPAAGMFAEFLIPFLLAEYCPPVTGHILFPDMITWIYLPIISHSDINISKLSPVFGYERSVFV